MFQPCTFGMHRFYEYDASDNDYEGTCACCELHSRQYQYCLACLNIYCCASCRISHHTQMEIEGKGVCKHSPEDWDPSYDSGTPE